MRHAALDQTSLQAVVLELLLAPGAREEFVGNRYLRIKHIQELQQSGRLDGELRWTGVTAPASDNALTAAV